MSPRLDASTCACGWEGTFGLHGSYEALQVFGAGLAPSDASLPPWQSF